MKLKLWLKKLFNTSPTLIFCLIVLSIVGSFFIISASMSSTTQAGALTFVAAKQVVFLFLSFLALYFLANYFSFNWLKKDSLRVIVVVTLLLSLLATRILFPSQGATTGAYNWLNFKYFTIQPSEFVKIFAILYTSYVVNKIEVKEWMSQRRYVRNFKLNFRYMLDSIGINLLIIFLMIGIVLIYQKDFGTAAIIGLIFFSQMCFVAHPVIKTVMRKIFKYFLILLLILLFLISPLGLNLLSSIGILREYQLNRIMVLYDVFNPKYMYGSSYQLLRGLYAFARGGLFGVGLGKSIMKFGWLPESETDFIMAIVIEESGFFGFLIISLAYFGIIYTLLSYALKIAGQKEKLTLIGIATYFILHFVINIGGVSGLIPLTGVPLLLISSGGSSQLVAFMALGIAINIIARYKKRLLEQRDKL